VVQLNKKLAVDGHGLSERARISCVSELKCSQENNPGTGKSHREIQKFTGISRSSVRRITKRDLQLNVFRRKKAHLLGES